MKTPFILLNDGRPWYKQLITGVFGAIYLLVGMSALGIFALGVYGLGTAIICNLSEVWIRIVQYILLCVALVAFVFIREWAESGKKEYMSQSRLTDM